MLNSCFLRRCDQKRIMPFMIVLFCVSLLVPGARLQAQVDVGINGTVTDLTGASLPDSSVTIASPSTGQMTHTRTDSSGAFRVIAINPGSYVVTVEHAGFKRQVQSGVIVEVGKMTGVTLQLSPGEVTQTVNVEAEALSLNTESPELGTTLEPALIDVAPIEINGGARQIDSFVFLAPGVQGNTFAKTINGGVNFESEVEFNGLPAVQAETPGFQTLLNPPYEMVSEFRVVSSAFSAQYGLAKGAVTYQMASGSNRLHGDAFEILRNQLFDSSGFFPTSFDGAGHPRPPVNQQNNYGFMVSGPVWLPKIYKGKNKTFFLFTDDWYRENLAQKQIGTVPTDAMKSGDFSNFVDASGNQIPIYDPQTGQPFPGNIIPQSRFSALSQSILPLITSPNRSGLDGGNLANIGPVIPVAEYQAEPLGIHVRSPYLRYTVDSIQ